MIRMGIINKLNMGIVRKIMEIDMLRKSPDNHEYDVV